jgi:4-amino-4-deoxy-L-arabinose transferase-like glycosyltransferase
MTEQVQTQPLLPIRRLSGVRRLHVPRPLALLLLLALIEVFAWIAATPALQGPDETAHYAYTQNLAENGKKPLPNTGNGSESTLAGSAAYYLDLRALAGNPGARPLWSKADRDGWKAVEERLPPSARKDVGGPNAVAKNPPLYYAYEAAVYKAFSGTQFFTQLFWMRVASGLLFVLTVLFSWLLASELFARIWMRVLATSVVALQPTLTYSAGIITPDTLLVTLWSAFFFLAVRTVLRGPSVRRLVGIAVVVVCTLLTHGRGIAILPPALIAVALAYYRHRPQWRRQIRIGSLVGAVVLVGLGWYVLVNGELPGPYGGELNVPPEARHPTQFLSFVWQFYFPKLPWMEPRIGPAYGFNQVYVVGLLGGRFGSLDTLFSQQVYDLVELFVIGGAILLVTAVIARASELRPRWDVVALLVLSALSLVLFLHFASYRALATQVQKLDPLIVGRYLMPLIPLFALAVTALVGSARRWSLHLAGLVLGLAIVHQLGALGLVLARFYG